MTDRVAATCMDCGMDHIVTRRTVRKVVAQDPILRWNVERHASLYLQALGDGCCQYRCPSCTGVVSVPIAHRNTRV